MVGLEDQRDQSRPRLQGKAESGAALPDSCDALRFDCQEALHATLQMYLVVELNLTATKLLANLPQLRFVSFLSRF